MNITDPANPVHVSTVAHAEATACTRADVADILAQIRDGHWAERVGLVRSTLATAGKDAANAIKRTLPGILCSGEFIARRKSGLVRHSGLICADFDHVADPVALRNLVAGSAHCVAAFISPSGDGVKALFAVDPTRPHAESWRAVNAHCRATFGVEIDAACKDVSRLCFVSHDPDAFIAAGDVACLEYPPAEVAPVTTQPATVQPSPGAVLSPGDDYNARGDVPALLRKYGWSSVDDEEWTRPGKQSGLSATLGRLDEHPRAFFNFSSSPQAAPFVAQEIYQPWHVFALLECGGDFNAAAVELRRLGFGAPTTEASGSIYFDGISYFRLERDGRFGRLGRTDVQLHLKMQGKSTRTPKGVEISEAEKALFEIQRANRVTYAAPFCGRPVGLYYENGNAILATDSPTIIPAADGSPAALEDFFRNLFGEGQDANADAQFDVFVGWLQRLRRALANPAQHLPGQALFLIGPASCGKTLAQNLITRMAGGRSADPSGWIFKNADFNDGLWGAELLILSDANVEDVSGARRKLRDRLKQLVANDIAPCHRKHRGEISLRPIWRVVVSANPDADSASVIPTLDESIADKVIYLKCYTPPSPFPTETEEGAASFYNGLVAAMPAFLSAVEGFDVPAPLRGVRFGVREFHHPTIVAMVEGAHQDAEIGELVESWLSRMDGEAATGSATELFGLLNMTHDSTFGRTCRSPTALGQALHRMARVAGWSGRISSDRTGPTRQTRWTIRKAAVDPVAA